MRVEAVRDVHLPYITGSEELLDGFYLGLLRFERKAADFPPAYEAENVAIRFVRHDTRPDRHDVRPVGIVSDDYLDSVERLRDAEVEVEEVKGLVAGSDGLLLRDPAGNWLTLAPRREIR